jgi:hypothetical protein
MRWHLNAIFVMTPALALTLTACGGSETSLDAGRDTGAEPSDSGSVTDTGPIVFDGGGEDDAGNDGDAGIDGSGPHDAALPEDTGPLPDSGTVCSPGRQDADGNGTCELGCDATGPDALNCGPGGSCEVSAATGLRACSCEPGYDGATCDMCLPGYAAGAGGTCELDLPPTTNLSLWLDADDMTSITVNGSGGVISWHDRRPGLDTSLTQSAGTAIPAFVAGARNGRGAVRFDGGDQLFDTGYFGVATDDYEIIVALSVNIAGGTPSAIIGATQGTSSTDWAVMLEQHANTDYRLVHRATPGTTGGETVTADRIGSLGAGWVAASHASSGAIDTMAIWASDSPTDAMGLGAVTPSMGIGGTGMTIRLGRTQTGFMRGDIYEVLIYTRRLTVAERDQVTAYLEAKWALR